MHTSVRVHICMCAHLCVCTSVHCTSVCAHLFVCICLCVHICVCAHLCIAHLCVCTSVRTSLHWREGEETGESPELIGQSVQPTGSMRTPGTMRNTVSKDKVEDDTSRYQCQPLLSNKQMHMHAHVCLHTHTHSHTEILL